MAEQDPFYDLDLPEALRRKEQDEKYRNWLKQCGLLVIIVVLFYFVIPPILSRSDGHGVQKSQTKTILLSNADEKKNIEQKIVALETALKVLKSKAQKKANERERLLQDQLDKQKETVSTLLETISLLETQQKRINETLGSVSTTLDSAGGNSQPISCNQASAESLNGDAIDMTPLETLRTDVAMLTSELELLKNKPPSTTDLSEVVSKVMRHARELHGRVGNLNSVIDATAAAAAAATTKEPKTTVSCPICPEITEKPPSEEDCASALQQQATAFEAKNTASIDSLKLEARRDCQREVAQRLANFETETQKQAELLTIAQTELQSLQKQIAQGRGATKPQVPRADFAQRSAGGRVDHHNTSQTYVPPHWQLSNVARASLQSYGIGHELSDMIPLAFIEAKLLQLAAFLGIDRDTGIPEDAISTDMTLGSCWPMAGQEGFLTVDLQHEVMVDAVSIQHIAR